MSSETSPAWLVQPGRPRAGGALPLLVLLLVLFGPLTGCGKKGPPEPPLRFVPKAGQDLEVAQQGRELVFEMTYPGETVAGLPLPPVERVELWALSRPFTPAGEVGGPGPEGDPEGDETEGGEAADTGTEAPGATGQQTEPQQAETQQAREAPLPEPADPRQILAMGEPALVLAGRDLSEATVGGRLLFRVPVPSPEPPTVWFFALRTVISEQDVSELSNQAIIVPVEPPAAPTGLQLEAIEEGIRVSWSLPEDPAVAPLGFNLYRRDPQTRFWGDPLRSLPADRESFLDGSTVLGQAYIYTVTTVVSRDPLIESAPGGAREIDYRDVFPPSPPGDVVALGEEGRVRVVWEASPATDVAGYHVDRRRPDGDWERLTEAPVTGGEHLDRGLPTGEVLLYRVSAVDQAGNEGPPSPEARAEVR